MPSRFGTFRRTPRHPLVILAAVAMLLAGCDSILEPPTNDEQSVISGTLTLADAGNERSDEGFTPIRQVTNRESEGADVHSSEVASDAQRLAATYIDAPSATIVPGDVIVAFRPGAMAASSSTLQVAGRTLSNIRPLGDSGARLMKVDADADETRRIVRELAQRSDVRYVEVNRILQPLANPNDTVWQDSRSWLWHYDSINLETAWDSSTGEGIVVAVVDTGILVDLDDSSTSVSHPELFANTLPGYDFISDPGMALDGDARDDNAYDDGDEPLGSDFSPSYHGTHVAGTIAAVANNNLGIPGVAWDAKIVPVRVLGYGGGTLIDIIEGTLWAANLLDGLTNPNPADVINLSLGGEGECSVFAQEAFDAIEEAGIVTVVAAGNSNMDAGGFMPANCRNVITVGASNIIDERSWFSNYGSRIDVMAPGGESVNSAQDAILDRNSDGIADGVVSTLADRSAAGALTMNLELYDGTSMAAPHVAGVAALLLAIDEDLTPFEIKDILRTTAVPLSADACDTPSGLASDCGTGVIDAAAAVEAAVSGSWGDAILRIEPNPVDFGATENTLSITVQNTSAVDADWILVYEDDGDNPASLLEGWIAGQETGTLTSGQSTTIQLTLDRDYISVDGSYQARLLFLDSGSNDELGRFYVRVIEGATATSTSGPTWVRSYVYDENTLTGWVESGGSSYSTFQSTYQVTTARAGYTYLLSVVDVNDDGEFDQGDYLGQSDVFYVFLGTNYPNKNVTLSRGFGDPLALEGLSVEDALRAYAEQVLPTSVPTLPAP